jgi:hypothetical protein
VTPGSCVVPGCENPEVLPENGLCLPRSALQVLVPSLGGASNG